MNIVQNNAKVTVNLKDSKTLAFLQGMVNHAYNPHMRMRHWLQTLAPRQKLTNLVRPYLKINFKKNVGDVG